MEEALSFPSRCVVWELHGLRTRHAPNGWMDKKATNKLHSLFRGPQRMLVAYTGFILVLLNLLFPSSTGSHSVSKRR